MNDLREVDLERGMPRAEQAIRQMLFELRRSPGLGCSGVKLIHGYGSSGAGGRIRVEARRRLDRMKAGGEIWATSPESPSPSLTPTPWPPFSAVPPCGGTGTWSGTTTA